MQLPKKPKKQDRRQTFVDSLKCETAHELFKIAKNYEEGTNGREKDEQMAMELYLAANRKGGHCPAMLRWQALKASSTSRVQSSRPVELDSTRQTTKPEAEEQPNLQGGLEQTPFPGNPMGGAFSTESPRTTDKPVRQRRQTPRRDPHFRGSSLSSDELGGASPSERCASGQPGDPLTVSSDNESESETGAGQAQAQAPEAGMSRLLPPPVKRRKRVAARVPCGRAPATARAHLPSNWQVHVGFTQRVYTTPTPDAAQQEVHRKLSRPTAGVQIREVQDTRHPTFRGLGLFSTKQWTKGDRLGCYTGVLRSRGDTEGTDSRYIFKVGDTEWDIDAEHFGNEFRFLNAPKLREHMADGTTKVHRIADPVTGKDKTANVVAQHSIQDCDDYDPKVFLFAKCDIGPGEELLVDYGPDYRLEARPASIAVSH